MMKRLLVLVLVLGLAGAAQAGLEWQIQGGTKLVDGSWVVSAGTNYTINLVSTDKNCNGYAIDAVAEVDASGNSTNGGGQVLSFTPTAGGSKNQDVEIDNYQGNLFCVPSYVYSTPIAANTPILSFVYKVATPFSGKVTIALLDTDKIYTWDGGDGDNYAVSGSTVNLGGDGNVQFTTAITLVPEPMTIGLLGLGGLFLRRKK